MNCTTLKQGVECVFMTNKGCSFNGGSCHTIIEACEGCQRVLETPSGRFCASVPDPRVKWRRGNCNLATHAKNLAQAAQVKVNPLKASKRAAR